MKLNLPEIAENEKSLQVLQLLFVIEQQANIIERLNQQVQQLKDEIARLKNQPPRPKINLMVLSATFAFQCTTLTQWGLLV